MQNMQKAGEKQNKMENLESNDMVDLLKIYGLKSLQDIVRIYPLTPEEVMKPNEKQEFRNKLKTVINNKTQKTMSRYYILGKGKVPAMITDVKEWSEKFEKQSRVVKQDTINGAFISTVFLGIDHSFGTSAVPLLFETMIFNEGGPQDQYQQRYSTWRAALAGHKKACELITKAPISVQEVTQTTLFEE